MQPQSEPLAPGLAVGPGGLAAAANRLARLAGAPAAVVAAAAAWVLLRGIDHRFISFSDGAYMYAASEAAAHGVHTLYRTIALSLPPGVPLGATLAWRASPQVETVRLALALLAVVTALLTYRAARVLFDLSSGWAAVAAVLALTAPVHAQFVGLEGEAVITPLALVLALTLERRRVAAATAVMAAGFFFKLTWAPFFLAGVLVLGRRRGAGAGICALGAAAAVYLIAIRSFGWSAHDLAAQLVFAEAHSGTQLALLPGLMAATAVLWWPFFALAPTGIADATRATRYVVAAAAACGLYMSKQGTFFNVLDPLEPFLALLATAGAYALWRRRTQWRALVVVCAIGAAIHIASVSTGSLGRAFPIPVGAAIVNTDNQTTVDRLARIVDAHSTRAQPVLVNPLIAVVAQRREPAAAADWFILHALGSDWRSVKAFARRGRVPVVSVDSNVVTFDPSFRSDVGLASFRRVARVDAPPIKTTIYVRR